MEKLIDTFARHISYLRLSVTDRCDLRCVYCMPKNMTFMPKKDLATLEESYQLVKIFTDLGIEKLRVTGGEPLVRRNILWLMEQLGELKQTGGLKKLVMTSNATQLAKMAKPLKAAGIDSINISLDSLDTHLFELVTNGGNLKQVLAGIDAAVENDISIKINVVALKGVNDLAIDDFVRFGAEKKCDITFIEVMPMGDMGNETRVAQYLPLDEVKQHLHKNWQLTPSTYKSGGPARYYNCAETGQRIGFITPLSQNFCAQCNRVRLTATGKLYSCLGQDNQYDLLTILRMQGEQAVRDMIHQAIFEKPKSHDFEIRKDYVAQTNRFMSVTGG
ncbi:MAG: GTP 3',8-cyclase MoaA [Alphaproteobacteria bacterium]|nr:GTP 3',8-cyclase MoaA [Alphaproteobacteria bacterium]